MIKRVIEPCFCSHCFHAEGILKSAKKMLDQMEHANRTPYRGDGSEGTYTNRLQPGNMAHVPYTHVCARAPIISCLTGTCSLPSECKKGYLEEREGHLKSAKRQRQIRSYEILGAQRFHTGHASHRLFHAHAQARNGSAVLSCRVQARDSWKSAEEHPQECKEDGQQLVSLTKAVLVRRPSLARAKTHCVLPLRVQKGPPRGGRGTFSRVQRERAQQAVGEAPPSDLHSSTRKTSRKRSTATLSQNPQKHGIGAKRGRKRASPSLPVHRASPKFQNHPSARVNATQMPQPKDHVMRDSMCKRLQCTVDKSTMIQANQGC